MLTCMKLLLILIKWLCISFLLRLQNVEKLTLHVNSYEENIILLTFFILHFRHHFLLSSLLVYVIQFVFRNRFKEKFVFRRIDCMI